MEAPKPEVTVNALTRQRNRIRAEIIYVKELVLVAEAPVVQELVIAQRSLEDARMRVGVARAYFEKKDPIAVEHVNIEDDEDAE